MDTSTDTSSDVLLVGDDAALDAYSRVVSDVARAIIPSVASLRVMARVQGGRRPRGAGSAVTVTPDGFLLTSAHVVDGRELEFAVVGADALSDLAVVRVAGADLVPARLGDADTLRVGQLVVAVGSPLGFSGSISAGVVSALGRSLATRAGDAVRLVENVIQTDAALHPGNSGGALATGSAEVVGVNTAVVGPGIGQGLGMAVPINAATRGIIASLMRDGRVRRAFLGIAGGPRPLPPRAAATAGRTHGIEVLSVVPDSPAARAGLRPEDIIVSVDGEPTADVGALQAMMTWERIGRRCAVTIVRHGAVEEVVAVPDELG